MTSKNKTLLIVGSVLLVATVSVATALLISNLSQQEDPKDDSSSQQQKDASEFLQDAHKNTKEAAEHEAAGETEAAIEDYKRAKENFEKANDEAGAEGSRMQIEYLENLPSEPLVDTPDPEPMVRGQEHLYD